ncbi:MAG: 30S ribosomal protein S8 [Pseudomonadota bacterium]|jgi:small subunit ribosomal protein S8|nr:30S ribosomal protein S8 [Pseudomonadota bacterium]MBU1183565.1 30S ribosomal protein S8 [Pseudomonadota bacterium]MBU2027164.1 30S ribosomal protein S8 [Pseudomonadota bacterium]MBU3932818.1 30S ribosomal protein S8 [Pseudomonadota bacterium]MBU4120075.1 30S ribosomal protein S8 [Pseudomonadota bacterium]
MGMTDPIADMLTRIRNANRVHFKSVDVLSSRINLNMAKVLKKSGYISGYDIKNDPRGHEILRVYLKYPDTKRTVITDIQRVSKPGRRVYVKSENIPQVLNGYGISILSTSRGVMTDKEARELRLGGELLCNVW